MSNLSWMAGDWYRTADWSPAAREEFERRLARSRPHNRPQYLRIKAIALRDAEHVDAAGSVLKRILVEYPTRDVARQQGSLERAEEMYRRALAHTRPGLRSGLPGLYLAELLIDRGDDDALEEAEHLLESTARQAQTFHNSWFRWCLAVIGLAERRRDTPTQREVARTALELLDAGPPFPRHPTVGLATTDKKTAEYLAVLADADDYM
jgi:tetratricopeptide (TPR) repeat protein